MIEINISGVGELTQLLKRAGVNAPGLANRITTEVAEATEQGAKERVQSWAATGRTYRRYNPFRIHQASAPGEPPATDLGNLLSLIGIESLRVNQYASRHVVYSDAVYARILEEGGFAGNGSYIAPRPYLGPAFDEALDEVETEFGIYVDGLFR